MRPRFGTSLIVAALLAACAALVAAILPNSNDEVSVGAPAVTADPQCVPLSVKDGGPESGAAEILGILRRARTTCDALPSDGRVERLAGDDGAVDLGAARRVRPPAAQTDTWIAPGAGAHADEACIMSNGFLGCPAVASLKEDGASVVYGWRGDEVTIHGIAVDGISTVTLKYPDGTRAAVPVTDNAFVRVDDRWPVLASWSGPKGTETQTITRPE